MFTPNFFADIRQEPAAVFLERNRKEKNLSNLPSFWVLLLLVFGFFSILDFWRETMVRMP